MKKIIFFFKNWLFNIRKSVLWRLRTSLWIVLMTWSRLNHSGDWRTIRDLILAVEWCLKKIPLQKFCKGIW